LGRGRGGAGKENRTEHRKQPRGKGLVTEKKKRHVHGRAVAEKKPGGPPTIGIYWGKVSWVKGVGALSQGGAVSLKGGGGSESVQKMLFFKDWN